jgi:hypothetical protein
VVLVLELVLGYDVLELVLVYDVLELVLEYDVLELVVVVVLDAIFCNMQHNWLLDLSRTRILHYVALGNLTLYFDIHFDPMLVEQAQ